MNRICKVIHVPKGLFRYWYIIKHFRTQYGPGPRNPTACNNRGSQLLYNGICYLATNWRHGVLGNEPSYLSKIKGGRKRLECYFSFLLLLFSHSLVSNSLWPHGLQHARPPCPSSPRACSNSCSFSQCCHPTISSSVIPFSSCLLSFPVSGSFSMSQFFTSGGQSIGASALASELLVKIQGWFTSGLTG